MELVMTSFSNIVIKSSNFQVDLKKKWTFNTNTYDAMGEGPRFQNIGWFRCY
jgi:hypothetical protein